MQLKSAFMQCISWNDYRILLALMRTESLAGAADVLDLNATTVSRRVKAMEAIAGTALIERGVSGRVRLSQIGQSLADLAERMEEHADAGEALVGRDAQLNGTVRLTAVPFLLNRLIVPSMAEFSQMHPKLNISLIPDGHNLSLTRREVDLAIRFGEPREGGDAVLAQKIGSVAFSVFTAKTMPHVHELERLWIVYDPVAGHLPQASWTNMLAKADGGAVSTLLMHDLEAVYEAVLSTPSRALLPTMVARKDPRLVELHHQTAPVPMIREVWLLRNRDMRGVGRIDAALNWILDARLFA